MAYMHSDLGGFAGGEVLDAELYTRWLQYGVFQPIYRPHAQESVAAEPVFHDDKTKALAKKSIELRYQLLPYNYTLAFENNQKGNPLMRPLFFEEPENTILQNSSDAYLWGNDLLIVPILKSGISEKEIYFPKSSNWFDFYTDKKYKGGIVNTIKTEPDHIPTFVRAGTFIPMIKTIQNTEQYSLKNFDLHYYFNQDVKKSTGKLYNDDGATPNAYEKGKYEILTFQSLVKSKEISIEINSKVGKDFQASDKEITLIIHSIPVPPKKIKKYRSDWDVEKHQLKIIIPYKNSKQTIKIKLK